MERCGIVTYEYDNDILYQIHTFNTSDELIVHNNGLCDILLVGGGGGGGEGDNSDGGGGGGGGGGLIYMENYLVYNGVYEVIVGDSVSSYTTGLNTIFNGLIALGGGRGGLGYTSGANRDGGCGGGGGRNYTLGGIGLQPTSESGGFGYNGGNGGGPNKRSGGGGGGTNGIGINGGSNKGGDGGNGLQIWGTYYGGGGSGSVRNGGAGGSGVFKIRYPI